MSAYRHRAVPDRDPRARPRPGSATCSRSPATCSAPRVVGILGDHQTGAIGNIGDTVTALMLLQLPTLWLVWRYLPETKGRELEEISA